MRYLKCVTSIAFSTENIDFLQYCTKVCSFTAGKASTPEEEPDTLQDLEALFNLRERERPGSYPTIVTLIVPY
jgi:hypothetical protein